MNKMTRRAFAVTGVALSLAPRAGFAQQRQPIRARGTVEKVDGNVFDVKLRDGSAAQLRLKDGAVVRGVVPITLADIKAGMMVGVTSIPQADGTLKAYEVHTFPPQQRVNEGHTKYDTEPNSLMTNGLLETSVADVNGQVLTVKYKQGDKVEEKKVVITPQTILVTTLPGDKSEIKPGAKFVVFGALKQPDGSLEVATISVGRNGLTPPM